MKTTIRHLCGKIKPVFSHIFNTLFSPRSQVIQTDGTTKVIETPEGFRFSIDISSSSYIDRLLCTSGIFEPDSSKLVEVLIQPGDTVLDIGANIGYYTVRFAKLSTPNGRVFAFEPTPRFRNKLLENLRLNQHTKVTVYDFGLSNVTAGAQIFTDQQGATATLYAGHENRSGQTDTISLRTLDDVFPELGIDRLNFIKIDVDGNEPKILEGGRKTLETFDPFILLEISHLHYLRAGYTAWDIFKEWQATGYHIYAESDLTEIVDLEDFLIKCGNFDHSSNIILKKAPIPDSYKNNLLRLKAISS